MTPNYDTKSPFFCVCKKRGVDFAHASLEFFREHAAEPLAHKRTVGPWLTDKTFINPFVARRARHEWVYSGNAARSKALPE
jgi:hypothetical protein